MIRFFCGLCYSFAWRLASNISSQAGRKFSFFWSPAILLAALEKFANNPELKCEAMQIIPNWKQILITSFTVVLAFLFFFPNPADASIRTTEEDNGTTLYKSFHQLQDSQQQSWQVVLFKKEREDDSEGKLKLRLVGYPGQVKIAHPKPLVVEANRAAWQAEDLFAEGSPSPNVGQYDLGKIIYQLSQDNNTLLKIPEANRNQRTLKVPGVIILEWKIVAGNNN